MDSQFDRLASPAIAHIVDATLAEPDKHKELVIQASEECPVTAIIMES